MQVLPLQAGENGPAMAPEGSAMVVAPAPADPPAGKYVAEIHKFSELREKRFNSEPFMVAGSAWKLLMFPKGNGVDQLSLYLEVAGVEKEDSDWSRSATFYLTVLSQTDPMFHAKKDSTHTFNIREPDWGFTQFLPLASLHDPAKGYLVDDTLRVEVEVKIGKPHWHYASHDSKKETGFIGFKNQGATCYMNSLLQTLFHIPFFRKAVYHMPTTETDTPERSIPLALQSLFYKMQFQETSVGTKELTTSFGWDSVDAFTQHDVQELNRVLCEKLDEKMKGTTVEGTIQKLFEGQTLMYVECLNVSFRSTRTEAFQDLQLDVQGCKNVKESFEKYVAVEQLDGANQYDAKEQGHGMQDARKGVWFKEFPPVLELQLKRFDYDFNRDTMVKINSRYEFPSELDLDDFLAPDADRSIPSKYALHSVLVHSGGVHGGHYYAYIRPSLDPDGQWFKFDDERVTKEPPEAAIDQQFGGDDEPPNPVYGNFNYKMARSSNAYMLVYVRISEKDHIMCPVAEEEIAEHLRARLKREADEKARKKQEQAEAHLYTVVKVATDDDLGKQIGTDLFFDLVQHERCTHFRVRKETPFSDVQAMVAERLAVPVPQQRFWCWAKRQNHTYRPSRTLTAAEEALPVGTLRDTLAKDNSLRTTEFGTNLTDLRLFLEAPDAAAAAQQPQRGPSEILIFFKVFDPAAGTLRYAGRRTVPLGALIGSLRDFCNQRAGYLPTTELRFFEEIKCEPDMMIEDLDAKMTLKAAQLEDGDIICFQRGAPVPGARHQTVLDFMGFVKNRVVVDFRELDKPKEPGFTLELLKQQTYDEVTEALAAALGGARGERVEHTHCRLTQHNPYTHSPKPQPLRWHGVERLSEMTSQQGGGGSEIVYYEVLDIPVQELEQLKQLKVAFINRKTEEVGTFTLRMPKECSVSDALEQLRGKLGDKLAPGAHLRMTEIYSNRIYKIFPPTERIDSINDQYWLLRAEEVPEDELEVGPTERLIHVYHFAPPSQAHIAGNGGEFRGVVVNFGEPFLMKVRDGEPLREMKARIQQKLGISGEEFSKWKVAFVVAGRPEYMEDDDELVAGRFERKSALGVNENYFGLQHEDKSPKRNNRVGAERALTIKGV